MKDIVQQILAGNPLHELRQEKPRARKKRKPISAEVLREVANKYKRTKPRRKDYFFKDEAKQLGIHWQTLQKRLEDEKLIGVGFER